MSKQGSRSLSLRSRQNLLEAMKEEAFALAQCKMLARQARKDRRKKLADVLEEAAERHYLKHFVRQAELLSGGAPQPFEVAVVEESLVVDTICKLFARQANQDGDAELARRLDAARADEVLERIALGIAMQSSSVRKKNTRKTPDTLQRSRRT